MHHSIKSDEVLTVQIMKNRNYLFFGQSGNSSSSTVSFTVTQTRACMVKGEMCLLEQVK